MIVWFAVLRPYLMGPTDIKNFGALCTTDKTPASKAYPSAAAYQGPGPHPIVVFPPFADADTYPDFTDDGRSDDRTSRQYPPARAVQLVGCSRALGRVPSDPGTTCNYLDGHYLGVFQGRFRVDIYEARTGRAVSSVRIDGSKDQPCPAIPIQPTAAPNTADDQPADITTSPDDAGYAAVLSPLVTGKAGS